MSKLTTVENVKLYLNITDNQEDDIIDLLIEDASSFFETYTNRKILTDTYVDIFKGRNYFHILKNAPIQEILSVKILNQEIKPQNRASFTEGYFFDKNKIVLYGYKFSNVDLGNEIIYKSGFDIVPKDIETAVIILTALRYKEKDRLGVKNKKINNEIVYFDLGIPEKVKLIMDQWIVPF